MHHRFSRGLGLLLLSCFSAAPLVGQVAWYLQPAGGPSARGAAAAAFNDLTGVGVLFGGGYNDGWTGSVGSTTVYGDTWTWDGQWTLATPVTSPSSRKYPSMTFDRARGKVVLFGGARYAAGQWSELSDTWTWDGVNWTLMQTPVAPPQRSDAAFGYDPLLQKCILFGGTGHTDTWEWDGFGWQQRFPATTPHWRNDASLTFDANRGRLAMISGWTYQGGWTALTDHWEWDGADWVLLSASIPLPRAGAFSVFDTARNRLVQYGGYTYWVYNSNETREFDGAAWTAVPTASPPPGLRNSVGFYDSWRGAAVMHGGWSQFGIGGSAIPDTWIFTNVGAATVTSYGPGCAGAAGTMALQVVQRPVVQTTFTLHIANVDPLAVPVMLIGWSPIAVGVGGLFGADPSCVLRTNWEILEVVFPLQSWSLAIPNNPNLLGLALHNQAAQFTYDAPSNTYDMSLSNAVRSTVGLY